MKNTYLCKGHVITASTKEEVIHKIVAMGEGSKNELMKLSTIYSNLLKEFNTPTWNAKLKASFYGALQFVELLSFYVPLSMREEFNKTKKFKYYVKGNDIVLDIVNVAKCTFSDSNKIYIINNFDNSKNEFYDIKKALDYLYKCLKK